MVEKKQGTENEPFAVRIWGIPIDRAIALLQSVGVPLGFMIFVCYLAWSYFPPVAAAHIDLLKRTGDTLEKMEGTLKDYNSTIDEFSKLGKETSIFMQQAREEHAKQLERLAKIESEVTKVNTNGN